MPCSLFHLLIKFWTGIPRPQDFLPLTIKNLITQWRISISQRQKQNINLTQSNSPIIMSQVLISKN